MVHLAILSRNVYDSMQLLLLCNQSLELFAYHHLIGKLRCLIREDKPLRCRSATKVTGKVNKQLSRSKVKVK